MTRDDFWDILDAAQSDAAFDRARLPDALRAQLEELDEDAVLAFVRHFDDLRHDAYRHEPWAAAWILGGGASDEDFSDFRDWLISQGRQPFDDALRDPERLLNHFDATELQDAFDPDIRQVATDLYTELTGQSDLPEGTVRPDPAQMGGRPWRPEDLPRRFPRLWRAFNP
jgi:hypothetical protein